MPGAGGAEFGLESGGTAMVLRKIRLGFCQGRLAGIALPAVVVETGLGVFQLPFQAREVVGQSLDFLLPGEHAGFLIGSPGNPDPARPDPHTMGRRHGFVGGQARAHAQGLGERVRRAHAGKNGSQRPGGIDLFRQGAGAAMGCFGASGSTCIEQCQPALGELIQGGSVLLQGIHANRFQMETQYHLHGPGPIVVHMQLLGEPGMFTEAGAAQPLHYRARALAESILLQRLKRGQPPAQCLLTFPGRVQGIAGFPFALTCPLQLFLAGRDRALQHQCVPLGALEFGAVLERTALQLLTGQILLLRAQALAALLQLRHGLYQVLDAGRLRIAHARRLRGLLAPGLPVRLPGMHGLFAGPKGQPGFGSLRLLPGEFRLQGLKLGTQLSEAPLLGIQVLTGAAQALFFGGKIFLQLLALAAQVLNRFFTPGDAGLGIEHPPINLVEGFGDGALVAAAFLELRFHPPLLGEAGLQRGFLGGHGLRLVPVFGIEPPPAQRQQLGFQIPLFLLEHLVLLGHGRLAFEMGKALAQLVAQIRKPVQIFRCIAHAAFGFPAALLVLGNPGRFLEKIPEFLRACLDQA